MTDKALYWFTRDLRIRDNSLLLKAARESHRLVCVAIVDPVWFQHRLWQRPAMSPLRWQFLYQSLVDLNQALQAYGQKLHIFYGSSRKTLVALIGEHSIDRLYVSHQAGSFEQGLVKEVQDDLPQLNIHQADQYTLFNREQLPFSLEEVPESYSKFRKQVEHLPVIKPSAKPLSLPPMPGSIQPLQAQQQPDWLPRPQVLAPQFKGGITAAAAHIQSYFSSAAPSRYKQLRNELAGWENSSKFSPWLAHGCVSPRQLKQALLSYEQAHGENESTYWLYVELLWREYFQWLHYRTGTKLFAFGGEQGKAPLTTFYPERFRKWCEGETPYALVNACMKELKATGYLSNRGRQIAASCLVNELAVDWRYGAAWFEHCLLDYDVAVNWGNWQYIAGVGADPRGGRHFNLEKQAQQYDPDKLYQRRWKAQAKPALDSRDAADWPIMPD